MTSDHGAVEASDELNRRAQLRPLGRSLLSTQAREAILDSIAQGHFPNGQLPPEEELAAQLGVSRTTIRAALQSLKREGLLTRRRGVGTAVNPIVNPNHLALQRLAGFKVVLTERGYRADVNAEAGFEPMQHDWSNRLGADPSTRAYVLRRLFTADGHPAIYVVDVVAPTALRVTPEQDERPDDLYEFFRVYGSRPIEYAVVEIQAKAVSSAIGHLLNLRRGAPIITLHETSYDVANRVLAFSEISVNDEYVQFDVVRRAE